MKKETVKYVLGLAGTVAAVVAGLYVYDRFVKKA